MKTGGIRGILNSSGLVRVATTLLHGPPSGTMTCAHAYDGSFAVLPTDCII